MAYIVDKYFGKLIVLFMVTVIFISVGAFIQQQVLEERLADAIESEYDLYVNGVETDIDSVDLDYMASSYSYNVSVDDDKKMILVTPITMGRTRSIPIFW